LTKPKKVTKQVIDGKIATSKTTQNKYDYLHMRKCGCDRNERSVEFLHKKA